MTAFARLQRLGAPLASAIATAAVFIGALWVQDARGAWPFAPETAAQLRSAAMPSAHGRPPLMIESP